MSVIIITLMMNIRLSKNKTDSGDFKMANNKKGTKPQTKKAVEKAKKNAIKASEKAKNTKNVTDVQAKDTKNIKAIIIAAVALLLVIAVVVGVVLVRKNKDNNGDSSGSTNINASVGYEYADYEGMSMPAELAEILKEADEDKADACKKYGVALELGERDISYSEFLMYYRDQHTNKINEIRQSYSEKGQNLTGYQPYVLPDKQNYGNENYSWQERFTMTATDDIIEDYLAFDLAVKAGTKLSDSTVAEVLREMENIKNLSTGKTPDDDMVKVYADGVTLAMYEAREIMSAYGYQYQVDKINGLMESYTDEEIYAEFEKDETAYSCVSCRIYPIEGEYNPSEISEIKNEQDFLNYAQNNYPFDAYDADFATKFIYSSKEVLSGYYGDEVGEWLFDSSRKKGDIAVVQGLLYRYLVYMDIPAMYTTSRDIVIASRSNEGLTEEDKNELIDATKQEYNEWMGNGANPEALAEMRSAAAYDGEITARAGYYNRAYSEWIFSSERKPGDKAFIESDEGCAMIYYVDNNPEDFDWMVKIRENMAIEETTEIFESTRETEYNEKRNEDVLNGAYSYINKKIESKMDTLELTQAAQ